MINGKIKPYVYIIENIQLSRSKMKGMQCKISEFLLIYFFFIACMINIFRTKSFILYKPWQYDFFIYFFSFYFFYLRNTFKFGIVYIVTLNISYMNHNAAFDKQKKNAPQKKIVSLTYFTYCCFSYRCRPCKFKCFARFLGNTWNRIQFLCLSVLFLLVFWCVCFNCIVMLILSTIRVFFRMILF